MNATSSVYYSYLKNLGACAEGLEWAATQSCYDATMNCCPTPELGNVWTNNLFSKTGGFDNNQIEFVSGKISQKTQEGGQSYAFEWVKQHFAKVYIDDVNRRTLVTENLLSHIDIGIPYSYMGNGEVIIDQTGSGNGALLQGDFSYTNTPKEFISLSTGGNINFGKSIPLWQEDELLSGDFTFRIVLRVGNFDNLDQNSSVGVGLFSRSNNNTSGFQFGISQEKFNCIWYDSNGQPNTISSNTTENQTNTWYDISITNLSSNLRIYRNALQVSSDLPWGGVKWCNEDFRLLHNPTQDFGLDFFHFSYYDRALSSEEVLRNYKAMRGRL